MIHTADCFFQPAGSVRDKRRDTNQPDKPLFHATGVFQSVFLLLVLFVLFFSFLSVI